MRSPLTVLAVGLAITAFTLPSASSLVTVHDAGKKQSLATRTQAWCVSRTASRPPKPDAAVAATRSPSFCETALASR